MAESGLNPGSRTPPGLRVRWEDYGGSAHPSGPPPACSELRGVHPGGRREVSRGSPPRPAHLAPSVWGSCRRKLGGPGTGDTPVAIPYPPLARWWWWRRQALEPKHSTASAPSSVGQDAAWATAVRPRPPLGGRTVAQRRLGMAEKQKLWPHRPVLPGRKGGGHLHEARSSGQGCDPSSLSGSSD